MEEYLTVKENPSEDEDFITRMKILEELYKEGKYSEGIKQALGFAKNFPKRATEFYSWALEFCELLDDKDQLLKLLKEGLDKGAWWSPAFLQIAYEEHFGDEEIYEQVMILATQKAPKDLLKAKLVVRTPENYNSSKAYPLVLILHGRGSNNENSDKHWSSEQSRKNTIVAFLQSSQPLSNVHYCWDDWNKSFDDIQAAYKTLAQKYTIDIKKSIIGGVSAGAEVALGALFEEKIPFKKMISTITSTGKVMERYVKKKRKIPNLKICFIVGEKDPRYKNTMKIHHYLQRKKHESKTIIVKEIGHAIPKNFDELLDQALDFLSRK